LLQPTVFVNSLLLIDSTALQQTFNDECRAYLEEGGTLKLKLPEKNGTSNRKIELKEVATIIRKEGKFGLRWENTGEEFFDNDCVVTTSKFLCFSLSLSLSHAVCAFLYTSHMHAPPVYLMCLPNTACARVKGGAGAFYSFTLQCPALIHLIDCMACDGQLAVHRKLPLQGALWLHHMVHQIRRRGSQRLQKSPRYSKMSSFALLFGSVSNVVN